MFDTDFDPEEEEMQHVSGEIAQLRRRIENGERGSVTQEEWSQMPMSVWEREHLFPVASDEVLANVVETCIDELGGELPNYKCASDYREALCRRLAPELLRRFRNQSQEA